MRAIRFSAFTEEEEQIEWLVEGLLPNVGWTLLVGQRKVGKTTFILQMAAAIQSGEQFLNRNTQHTDILYIQADSPTVEWREMVRRIAPESRGVTAIDVPNKALSNATYCEQLGRIIQRVKPKLIVWDSFYNLSGYNMNTEQGLIPIQTMKQLCVVDNEALPFILLHHPPHGEARGSGHNSIEANASNIWFLSKQKLGIQGGRLVKPEDILLSRDENGLWCERKRDEQEHDPYQRRNNYGIPI